MSRSGPFSFTLLASYLLVSSLASSDTLAKEKLQPKQSACVECAELFRIEKAARAQALSPRIAPFAVDAASVVARMSRKNPKLDSEQIERLISFSRAIVPKDHVNAFLSLIAPTIVENRAAIDAKLATLSKQEADYLTERIDDALKGPPKAAEDTLPGATATPPPPPGTTGK